jgi:3-oxoadipate enol-lactonase
MQTRIHDFTMAIEVAGHGIPLLLVHGFPLDKTLWELQINDLTNTARVIAPDLRGHGASDPVTGEYTMDLLADDCSALLEDLQVKDPAVVCGLSMGGYIAFSFYRRYPQWVAGLILAATRAKADSPEAQATRDKMAAKAEEQGAAAIAADLLPKILSPRTLSTNPELVERVKHMMANTSVQGIKGALMGMQSRPDSTPTLSEINVPTLILHGEDDQLIPQQEAHDMHAAIHDSQMHVLPQAGHLLNLEQPELFNQAVRQFLQTLKREN